MFKRYWIVSMFLALLFISFIIILRYINTSQSDHNTKLPNTVHTQQNVDITKLLQRIQNETGSSQSEAFKQLAELHDNATPAIPILLKLSQRESTRISSIYVLGEIGPAAHEAVIPLCILLESSNADKTFHRELTKAVIYTALGKIGNAECILSQAMKDVQNESIPGIRAAAVDALGRHGRNKANEILPIIIMAMNDEFPVVRKQAILSLYYLGKDAEPALPYLEKLILAETNDQIKRTAGKMIKHLKTVDDK